MSLNRKYHVSFNPRKIPSYNNKIPNYVSNFTYAPSFLYFIFTYSYRAARFLTDEFSVTVFR